MDERPGTESVALGGGQWAVMPRGRAGGAGGRGVLMALLQELNLRCLWVG